MGATAIRRKGISRTITADSGPFPVTGWEFIDGMAVKPNRQPSDLSIGDLRGCSQVIMPEDQGNKADMLQQLGLRLRRAHECSATARVAY